MSTTATTTTTTDAATSMDSRSGFNPATKTFHSLRPPIPLPPATAPLSITDYVLSLLHSSPHFSPSSPFLIHSSTHHSLSYSHFLHRISALSSAFPSSRHVSLILSPPSFHIPVLYFSLLSLGHVISAANPLSTPSELTHLIKLTSPSLIFCVNSLQHHLHGFNIPLVILDSPEFDAMLAGPPSGPRPTPRASIIRQDDTAVILYSSGTTGRVKAVKLSHRNFIALIATMVYRSEVIIEDGKKATSLFMLPMFHVFGFFMMIRAVAMAETLVMMPRFDLETMLAAVERYKVTYMPVSPPLVVAMANSAVAERYDLSSLETLGCGGAPLGKEVAKRFRNRFPNVEIAQGYGLTETGGGVASTIGPEECERYGSVGRLSQFVEAKIVDPFTGEALPPNQQGELWLRGPTIMKGYVGDKEATAETLLPDGWLKTGDLCYFDNDGFLYIVDRLKELIKYKGFQVPPAELERLLLSHPQISDAAVVPYPDDEAGQIPMAFVVRKPGSTVTGSQVIDYVAKLVSPYKKIRRVAFVDSIPKNPAGKILRRELIDQATSSPSKL